MNYLQPWLWYLLSALIMCIIFCGLERHKGKIGFTTKAVLSIWSILSLVITVMLFGLQQYINEIGGMPPLQVSGVTLGASCITLCISSGCIYCAS